MLFFYLSAFVQVSTYQTSYDHEEMQIDSLEYVAANSESTVRDKINALKQLCYLHRFRDPAKAIEYGKKALAIKDSDQHYEAVLGIYNHLGNIRFDQGMYAKAIEMYARVLKIADQYDQMDHLAHSLNDIGYVYYMHGIYELALENYQKSIRASLINDDDENLAVSYKNIGQAYMAMDKHDLAQEYFRKALKIHQNDQDSILIAHTHAYLGLLEASRGNTEEALALFRFSRDVFQRRDDLWLGGHVYKYIGDLYFDDGIYDEALKNYTQALVHFKKFDAKRDIAQMLIHIGEIYQMEGNIIEALAYLRNALNISIEHNYLIQKKNAFMLLSNLHANTGEKNKSLEYFRKYAETKDSIFSHHLTSTIAETEINKSLMKFDQELNSYERENRLERAVFVFIIIMILLLMAIVFLFYLRIKHQKRVNKLLSERSGILNKALKKQSISETKYKALFSRANDAIFLMDDETFIDCNEKTLEVFQCAREEIIGHSPHSFSPEVQPDNQPSKTKAAALIKKASEGKPQRFYWVHTKKDGTPFDTEVSLNTIELEDKTYLQAIIRDISEQKRAENAILKSKEIAEKSTHSKTSFLAKMSHEIRTPLNGIIGTSDILHNTSLTGEQKELLSIINTSANNLMSIVNEILDLSKIESGRIEIDPRAFNPRTLVKEIVDMHNVAAGDKQIRLYSHIPDNIPQALKGDDFRIGQALTNLVSNAIKFTKQGEVRVLLTAEKETETQARVLFRVVDTGIGISAALQEKLFREYSQLDPSITREFGGTGLGLTISKSLVDMMGGEIGVKSEKGKGSEFWFSLPLEILKMPTQIPGTTARAARKEGKNNLHILLAEDNPINQKVTTINLKGLGHEVDVAANGKIALEKYIKNRYDVILMDIQMPEMDGLEATARIREYERTHPGRQRVRIVALTANVLSRESETCYNAGMDDFISKPFKPEDLEEALNKG